MRELFHKIRIYGFAKSLKYGYDEIWSKLFRKFLLGSYSQSGEDIIIDGLLGNKKIGFYIEVGAYDPERFSNTNRFYQRGWKGITIEPNVVRHKKFLYSRSRDVNLNIGISNKSSVLTYYDFIPDTVSTFSESDVENNLKLGYVLKSKCSVKTQKLSEVIKKYSHGEVVDFFSIDTEGFDLEVLKSNNWNKCRPKVVCVEKRGTEVDNYLVKLGYTMHSDTEVNSIYLYIKP